MSYPKENPEVRAKRSKIERLIPGISDKKFVIIRKWASTEIRPELRDIQSQPASAPPDLLSEEDKRNLGRYIGDDEKKEVTQEAVMEFIPDLTVDKWVQAVEYVSSPILPSLVERKKRPQARTSEELKRAVLRYFGRRGTSTVRQRSEAKIRKFFRKHADLFPGWRVDSHANRLRHMWKKSTTVAFCKNAMFAADRQGL